MKLIVFRFFKRISDSYKLHFTALFNNMRTPKIQSSTDKCVFRCRQSNVRRLLLASEYYRASGYQIKSLSPHVVEKRSKAPSLMHALRAVFLGPLTTFCVPLTFASVVDLRHFGTCGRASG